VTKSPLQLADKQRVADARHQGQYLLQIIAYIAWHAFVF